MIVSVKFVSVPTQDQDRALAFYTEKLGFRLITDQPFGPDQRWIELGIGHSDTRFVLFTPPGEQDSVGGRFIYTQSTELRFPLPISADL